MNLQYKIDAISFGMGTIKPKTVRERWMAFRWSLYFWWAGRSIRKEFDLKQRNDMCDQFDQQMDQEGLSKEEKVNIMWEYSKCMAATYYDTKLPPFRVK